MNALTKAWRVFFRGWMTFAHVLGIVNTTLLLSIVFLLVVLPTRLIWWIIRKDPLHLQRTPFETLWEAREQDGPTLEERRHPF